MAGAGSREVGRISIRVVPDTDGFRRALKRQLESITKGLEAKVNVDPDVKGFRQKVNAATKGLDDAKVKVNVDKNSEILKKNGFFTDDTIKLKLDPKFDYMLRERLKRIAPVKVSVEPDIRTFRSRVGSALRGIFEQKSGPGAGRAFGGLGAFADSFVLVAAVAAILAPALALVSGALIALPAAIAGVMVPIGVLALGMEGIKKAAKSLAAPLGSLKKVVSDTFESRLTPVFKQLATVFPSLERSMPTVANGLSDMAKAFVDTVSSGPGMAKLNGTIENIGKALSLASPGIASFTDGMLGMVEKVSQKFPAVSEWFNQIGESFSNWVTKVSGNGQLDTAMSNFGKTVKEILGLVGDLATKGFEFLSDPEFGAKMEKFVKNLRKLADEVLPVLKTVFEDISDFLDDLLALLDRVNKFLAQFSKEGQDKAKEDRKKQFEVDKDKGAGQANLPAWADPEGWGISLRQKMSEIWIQVRTQVANAITEIVGLLAQVPSQVGNAWSSIVGIAQGVWNSVVQAVSGAMSSVVSTIVSTGGQIMTEVGSWPGRIAGFFANAGSLLVAAGRAMMDGLLSGIKAGAQAVFDFVSGLASRIASLKGPLPYDRKVLVPNGQALMTGLGTGLEKGFVKVEDQVSGMVDRLKKQFEDTNWGDLANKGMDAAWGFGEANGKQLMSDLGIGGGAITAALDQGLQFGKQALGNGLTQIFNTSTVDDTIALKNNQLNKKALGVVGKSG